MPEQDLFQDEVIRATDLNRGSGEVLNRAAKAPITIIRNDESYALMRREIAGRWRREARYAVDLTEIVWTALAHKNTVPPELRWISAFDAEDRELLSKELMEAYRKARRDGSWGVFENTLHAWAESGWAGLNPEPTKNYDEGMKSTQ